MSKIKSLLLQNFKQFSDASVDFQDGINLVIGQNGEGKSNMMEAIEICLNYIQADQSIMSRNQNVSHTYIGLKMSDFDIKFALTGDKKQFFLNDKLTSVQALETQQPCTIISIKQSQAYKLATFNGQQLFQYFQNKATLQNYQQKMDNIQQQLKEIQSKREQSKALIDDFKSSIDQLNVQVGQYNQYKNYKIQIQQIQYILEQNQLKQLQEEISQLKGKLIEEENQKKNADEAQKQTLQTIQNISEEITQNNNDLLNQQVIVQNITSIYNRLQQSPDFKDIGDAQSIQREISKYDVELQNKQQELDKLQFMLFKAQHQDKGVKLTDQQILELRQKNEQLRDKQNQLNNEIIDYETQCNELHNQIKDLKSKLPANQGSKLTNFLVQQDTVKRQCQKCEQDLQKSYEELYKCYSRNQYTIMEEIRKLGEKQQLKGFRGFFGELISTDDKMYIVLEQSGGHLLNQAVVDTTDNAMALIRTIQEKSRTQPELCGCRINILVLDQFDENRATISYSSQVQSQNNAQQFSSVIKVKSDCPELQKVVYHYFDRVLVVDSFELANQLAESYQCDCYTLQGDSVLRSGLINAGNHGSLKVQRYRAVTRLISQLQKIRLEIQQLDQQIQDEQSAQSMVTSIRQQLNQFQSKLHSQETQLNVLKTQHTEVTKEISQNEFILNSNENDGSQDVQDVISLKKQSDQLLTECTNIQEKRFQYQQKIQNIQQIITWINEMESYTNELTFQTINYQSICEKVIDYMQSCGKNEQKISTIMQELEQEKQKAERHASQQAVQIQAQNENIQLLSENISNKQNLYAQLQRNASLINSQIQNYKVPNEIERDKDNKNALQQKLQKLNSDIHELGDQNVVLYENVEEKRKQLEEVESEFAKFKQAEECIMAMLQEVNEKHLNELDHNYKVVSQKFNRIFNCLTGKEGSLILDTKRQELIFDLDPEYGGRVGMHQLSGGQQTLVSLTLIMSLASLDTCSIYLLDEVDSNLDLQIKIRFYEMLKETVAQGKAQVIISSFRREILPYVSGNIIEVKNGSLKVLTGPGEIEEGILQSTEQQ